MGEVRVTVESVPTFGKIAPILFENGYMPVPIMPGTKRPPIAAWQNYRYLETDYEHDGCYTGILTGHGVMGADLDILDPGTAEEVCKLAKQMLGKAPERVGLWPKRLLLYRVNGEFKKITMTLQHGKIELMGTGQQVVLYGMHPDTGKPYEWVSYATPLDIAASDLTLVEARHIEAFCTEVERRFGAQRKVTSTPGTAPAVPADERWGGWISNILKGTDLHDSINSLAAMYVGTGMAGGAAVQAIRAVMQNSAARTAEPERYTERYLDIPRAVSSAQEKFAFLMPSSGHSEPEPEARELVFSLAQLEARSSAMRWAVKGIVPEGSLGMIFGASGAFKSFVALDYALHRAWGLRWMGMKTRQAPQIYLAAEGGAGVIRRIIAWHQLHKLDWQQCPMHVVPFSLVLGTQARELATAVRATGFTGGDIIIDTLAQTYDGEENSANEMSAWLRVVGAELRDVFSSTVIIVHHSGHSATERPRGSSAILANIDFVFGCYRDEQQMIATLVCVKQKDGDKPPDVNFSLDRVVLGHDEDGDEVSSLAARHLDSVEAVLSAAKRTRGGQLNMILEAVGTGRPEKEVRLAFYSICEDANPEARKKAFQRARAAALAAGIVTIEGDWWSAAAQQEGKE